MNRKNITGKLSNLPEKDLISFRVNLHTGFCPMHIWEFRLEIMRDIIEVIEEIAERKGYTLPSPNQISRMFGGMKESDKNLPKYLGVSWNELEKTYIKE